jgi:6-phosphogluconolactonase
MKEQLIISDTSDQTVKKTGDSIYKILKNKTRPFYMALSGGETPQKLFRYLAAVKPNQIIWDDVHFFWADERCVPPDDEQSNYKMARKMLLRPLEISSDHIHRIHGEKKPFKECERYEREILNTLPAQNTLPQFDLILLGMGKDGHTASLFPGQESHIHSERIYDVSFHPETKQNRITITPKIIHSAKQVFFLITGENKAPAIKKVFKEKAPELPASLFIKNENVTWFLDQKAYNI